MGGFPIYTLEPPKASAWSQIRARLLRFLPFRFRLWLMRRSDEREVQRLYKKFEPLVEAAGEAKDNEKLNVLFVEYSREVRSILAPTYWLVAERLQRKARKLGIRIPDKDEEKGEWAGPIEQTMQRGRLRWRMLTPEGERKLRNEIREEERARADEWRKWATLFFVVVGTIFAFLSYRTKQRQPDPCPVNYYRNDSGTCVFALPAASHEAPSVKR